MKIHYLGTGAAEGIPAVFCRCAYCNEARRRGGKYIRSRSQLIIDGELSVDFSPDCFYHGAFFGADLSAIRYLIVTHSHIDHFYAQDFTLRGYKYALDIASPTLDIYGNEEVCEVFRESVRREMKEEIGETITLHSLQAFEEVRFGDWRTYPLKARHSSKDPFVYLLEKDGKRILHLCDTGLLPEEDYAFLASLGGKAADLITLDCSFFYDDEKTRSWRHMSLEDDAAVLRRLEEIGFCDGHTKKIITHFSHNTHIDEERIVRAEKEYGVTAAYDGMQIDV